MLALYEDGRMMSSLAMWSIKLQMQRLNSIEPELTEYQIQNLVDLHFMVTALTRLRKIAEMLSGLIDISTELREFDKKLPDLKNIRNILEHIDEYRIGEGRDKKVGINGLLTVGLDVENISWCGYDLNLIEALQLSEDLFEAIKNNPPLEYSNKVKFYK